MKPKGVFILIGAIGILGLLSLILVTFGQPSKEVFPSSLSSDPGGTLALYLLLQEEGIPVRRLFEKPKNASDIGVLVVFGKPTDMFASIGVYDIRNELPDVPVTIFVDLPSSVPSPSQMFSRKIVHRVEAYADVKRVYLPDDVASLDHTALIRTAKDSLTTLDVGENGVEINVPAGAMWLNQYIDREDNANHAVATIRLALKEGQVVAFPEYLYGVTGDTTLFQAFGPAYSSLVIQFLILFGLWIYSNLRRFGYPVQEPVPQPGSEAHIMAFAHALERANALDILLNDAIERLRKVATRKYRLPRDVPIEALADRLPASLGNLVREIARLPDRPKRAALLNLIRRLNEELDRHERSALG